MRNTTRAVALRTRLDAWARSLFLSSREVATHEHNAARVYMCVRAREHLDRRSERVKLKIPWNPRLQAVSMFSSDAFRAVEHENGAPVFLLPARSRPHRWFIGYLPFYLWAGWTVGSNAALEKGLRDYCWYYYYKILFHRAGPLFYMIRGKIFFF